MKWFYVEPEVAGRLGKDTVMERSVHPPSITRLHYELDGWLGDVLLESFPCFVVTESAKEELQFSQLTGAFFEDAEVTTSELFRDIYPERQLPKFVWLKVEGELGKDDFGLAPDGRLVASERALKELLKLGIAHAVITEFGS